LSKKLLKENETTSNNIIKQIRDINMNIFKSIGAIFAGFIAVFVLSFLTDFVLQELGVFPPQGTRNLLLVDASACTYISQHLYGNR